MQKPLWRLNTAGIGPHGEIRSDAVSVALIALGHPNAERNRAIILHAPEFVAACEEAERLLGNMGYTDPDSDEGQLFHQLGELLAQLPTMA
jgi:hypothetical protein